MSTNEATSQKSIGPITTTNPRSHTVVGVDDEGNWHHYHNDQDRVFIVGEDGLEEIKPMFERELGKWVDFVDARRGWEHLLVNTVTASDIFGDL